MCAPSRTALMTGLHTGHAPIRGNRQGLALGPDDVTIATLLRRMPHLRLAQKNVRWRKGITFRGLQELPLRCSQRTSSVSDY